MSDPPPSNLCARYYTQCRATVTLRSRAPTTPTFCWLRTTLKSPHPPPAFLLLTRLWHNIFLLTDNYSHLSDCLNFRPTPACPPPPLQPQHAPHPFNRLYSSSNLFRNSISGYLLSIFINLTSNLFLASFRFGLNL